MQPFCKTIRTSLVKGLMVSPLVAMSIPLGAIAAPGGSLNCPEGWVPRPPELNQQLGPCMPGTVVTPTQPDYQQFVAIMPDLQVKQYVFTSAKTMRVQVINTGNGNAGQSVLGLTIRRINGTPVGRTTKVKMPPIPAGQARWVSVDATSILPVAVDIKTTTFRLDADFSKAIAETNETNNTLWHNL